MPGFEPGTGLTLRLDVSDPGSSPCLSASSAQSADTTAVLRLKATPEALQPIARGAKQPRVPRPSLISTPAGLQPPGSPDPCPRSSSLSQSREARSERGGKQDRPQRPRRTGRIWTRPPRQTERPRPRCPPVPFSEATRTSPPRSCFQAGAVSRCAQTHPMVNDRNPNQLPILRFSAPLL